MAVQEDAAGLAALSICESLLIVLVEKGLIEADEARGALEDAAAAHQGAGRAGSLGPPHIMAAQLIERLITQVNAVGYAGSKGAE